MDNLFQIAARRKFRFSSLKGQLTVEQLYDLPLQAVSGFDLNSVAKEVNAELKAAGEEDFVGLVVSPARDELVQKLDLVKHIIQVKKDEAAAAQAAVARRQELRRLEEVLGRKQDAALENLSPEEIEKRIAALRG